MLGLVIISWILVGFISITIYENVNTNADTKKYNAPNILPPPNIPLPPIDE